MIGRFVFLLLAGAALSHAAVRLPSLLSDHAVLQRDMPVRIWGDADPREQITVQFRNQGATTEADGSGRWQVFLMPLAAGGPDELSVRGKNTVVVADVLVGEVWVASGQSNMAWTVARCDDAEKEIAAANFPAIRVFQVPLKSSEVPLDEIEGSWKSATPESVRQFSGVGYFFARYLHNHLKMPIGVIQSAWGGTPAEAWTSLPALTRDPVLLPHLERWAQAVTRYPQANFRYQRELKEWEAAKAAGRDSGRRPSPPTGPGHPWMPAGLYNAMIAPVTRHAIRGAIWYQGESNASPGRASLYHRLFSTMIQDWRRAWGQGDFHFLFVQLANFGKNSPDNSWPELREAQTEALALRNTGMAVTIDIGNPDDIHPTNKQDVGRRLGLAARAVAYGDRMVHSGPIYRQITAEPGGALRLWFDHVGSGLAVKGGELKGFVIAGADGRFAPAAARIDDKTVVVSSPEVKEPAAVRYAWDASPEANLYNMAGLPASPFRTDR